MYFDRQILMCSLIIVWWFSHSRNLSRRYMVI